MGDSTMFLLMFAAATVASPEAERLGRELAASGSLEVILPAIASKETEEVIAQHPELTPNDAELLRQTGQKVASEGREKLINAFGHQYAVALNIADLKSLVAFNRTAAARHYRRVIPAVTLAGLAALGKMDFKSDLAAAFCSERGKLCSR
jgi:hypothetical protein